MQIQSKYHPSRHCDSVATGKSSQMNKQLERLRTQVYWFPVLIRDYSRIICLYAFTLWMKSALKGREVLLFSSSTQPFRAFQLLAQVSLNSPLITLIIRRNFFHFSRSPDFYESFFCEQKNKIKTRVCGSSSAEWIRNNELWNEVAQWRSWFMHESSSRYQARNFQLKIYSKSESTNDHYSDEANADTITGKGS